MINSRQAYEVKLLNSHPKLFFCYYHVGMSHHSHLKILKITQRENKVAFWGYGHKSGHDVLSR